MTELAREYGMGLYELAQEENLCDEIHEQLLTIADCLKQNPDFVRLLQVRSLPIEERFQILEEVLGSDTNRYIVNFMKILIERGSISAFVDCVKVFHQAYNAENGIEEARVTSAVKLSQANIDALRSKLEKISGKKIVIDEEVDPSLLGGIRVEMNGHRMDNSIQTRLEELRRSLV